jgi:hypothetical protein
VGAWNGFARQEIQMKSKAVFLLLPALAWTGAGGGAPAKQPAQIVHDLRAERKGDRVTLSWSRPRAVAGSMVTTWICQSISRSPSSSNADDGCTPVGKIEAGSDTASNAASLRFSDTLDDKLQEANPPQFAVYHIEVTGRDGRSAGSSNRVSVSLAPTAPASQINFSLDPVGVYLIWQQDTETDPAGVEFDYRLWRQEKGTKKKIAVHFLHSVMHEDDGGLWSAVDTTMEWEKTYTYWITPVTRVYSASGGLLAEFEGDDSAPVEIKAHDVFPPATPEDLTAVPSETPSRKFVDLLWRPNTEPDLAGYNIYRREEGGALARIATAPANMLSYQDMHVSSGHRYFYAISAVDLRGNESGKTHESGDVTPR